MLSLDGINDLGQSAAVVDISGALTIAWAGKLKANYDGLSDDHYFVEGFIDANNNFTLHSNLITGDIRFQFIGSGDSAWVDLNGFTIVIDNYAIVTNN